eukprot:CAMPEP_0119152650 /NCGR_PEP_ID=MMETSP1310-20130426/48119_1 /TAXON_ID=464262 /ORGANISM="Genus nov. species nov., Strain RCC2339" /LENGTH=78 /DNA_ID=CAMNT_0007145037 /DNA_START=23 /DNA_END=259 /DNA_ORIENTATION=-
MTSSTRSVTPAMTIRDASPTRKLLADPVSNPRNRDRTSTQLMPSFSITTTTTPAFSLAFVSSGASRKSGSGNRPLTTA